VSHEDPWAENETPKRPWDRRLLIVAGVLAVVAAVTSVLLSQEAVQLEAGTITATVLALLVAFIVAATLCIVVLYVAARQRTRPEPPHS
jgi:peptidoglycan biosynthesis protein MviN/MurJ (putative lipid II flippase)